MMQMKKETVLIALFVVIALLTSGYGYMGKLPSLGETTKPAEKAETPEVKPKQDILPAGSIVPRPNGGLRANRYSTYLADIKEIDTLLKDIKTLLEEKRDDKVQLFCAKANLLGLYVDNLKAKYSGKPESYYESYKQLLILNKYLAEIVDYKLAIEKEMTTTRGTLANEQKDKKYLEQKIGNALAPVSTVIDIINDAG
jgi:hypothetical protein